MPDISNKRRKTWWPIHKENWFGDWFDPHESYLRLPSFWWPFTIIIIGVALVSWKVIHDQELVWGLESRVEQWYEWFKIPLWVSALLIPVLGLFNANHKSEQARAAMELTRSQNNFANYYKHVEEFTKYLDFTIKKIKDNPVSVSERSLHNLFFPNAKAGDFNPPLEVEEGFCGIVYRFIEMFCLNPATKLGHTDSLKALIIKQELELNNLFHEYVKFEDVLATYIKIDLDDSRMHKEDKDSSYLENHIRRLSFYLQILLFNTELKYASLMNRMLNVALRCWKERPDMDSDDLQEQSKHYLSLKRVLSKPREELRRYVEGLE